MIKSNIKGLANVLNKFDQRLKEIEKVKIKGGLNTTIKQTGNTLTINSEAQGEGGGGSVSIYYPWQIYMYTEPTPEGADPQEDPVKKIRCKGGLLNGLIPNNVDEDLISASSDANYYVYVEANFNGATIVKVELKAVLASSAPNLEYSYNKGSPPQDFRHLIGVVSDKAVSDQYLRKNLKVRPVIAYREKTGDNVSAIENYWSWDVFPL